MRIKLFEQIQIWRQSLTWWLACHPCSKGGIVFSSVRLCLYVCLSLSVNTITGEPFELSQNFQGIILWSKGRTSSKMVYRGARLRGWWFNDSGVLVTYIIVTTQHSKITTKRTATTNNTEAPHITRNQSSSMTRHEFKKARSKTGCIRRRLMSIGAAAELASFFGARPAI